MVDTPIPISTERHSSSEMADALKFDASAAPLIPEISAWLSLVGIPLKEMKTKPGVLVATIIRGSRIIIPGGNDSIEIGDSVIIVTMTKLMDLKDILEKH